MKLSDAELIAIGLNVQEYRRRGGVSVKNKFGVGYFKELQKRAVAKRKENKEKREIEAKTE